MMVKHCGGDTVVMLHHVKCKVSGEQNDRAQTRKYTIENV
jgi:hypothetical protein